MNARSQRLCNRVYCAAALLSALTLQAGCITQRGLDLPPLDDWQQRRQVLTDIREWSFSGRIAVSAGSDGFNGRLRWHQTDDDFAASVSGPLGAGRVSIDGGRGGITVTESNGQVTRLDDPEADLRHRYGWTIPVTSLRYWALGVPDPELPADTEFGEDGKLLRLLQGGWDVEIAQYRPGGGQPMPRRIKAVRDDARVRLVIDSWTFHSGVAEEVER